ncbi:MAG TPA: hypothetical protein EYG08_06210 [Myxococcales bacterium]|nr:hypothetical protein [Myxococcales bacterium]HIK84689.1 hypothetical protein [Myxococcales bacterium]
MVFVVNSSNAGNPRPYPSPIRRGDSVSSIGLCSPLDAGTRQGPHERQERKNESI